MKVQEVIFRAMAKKITWSQAAEVLGIPERTMLRRILIYKDRGYDPRFWSKGGRRRALEFVPLATAEAIFSLYQERYSGFGVDEFRVALERKHHIRVTRAWIELALIGAGLKQCDPVNRSATRVSACKRRRCLEQTDTRLKAQEQVGVRPYSGTYY
jgi:hypothetical protein